MIGWIIIHFTEYRQKVILLVEQFAIRLIDKHVHHRTGAFHIGNHQMGFIHVRIGIEIVHDKLIPYPNGRRHSLAS